MKKVYTAPQILFESFTMSTSIAAGCASIVTTFAEGQCAIQGTGGIAVFSSSMFPATCNMTPEGMGGTEDIWNGLCYHVPSEGINMFNS